MTERITSRQNPLLRHVTKLFSSRAYRYEQRQFAGDGTKLLAEAAMWCADDLSSVLFHNLLHDRKTDAASSLGRIP